MHSELRNGINRIISWIGWVMAPAAALLITAQLRADLGFRQAVQASVAGLVAMVPEGLVLLTSVAFAVGAGRLARRRVLTQELAAIEGLARVDVICLDKTGTLTEGELVLGEVEQLAPAAVGTDAAAESHAVATCRPTHRSIRCWPRWPRRRAPQPEPAGHRGPVRPTPAGPPTAPCPSRRPASGARRPSASTAPGCSARPTSC